MCAHLSLFPRNSAPHNLQARISRLPSISTSIFFCHSWTKALTWIRKKKERPHRLLIQMPHSMRKAKDGGSGEIRTHGWFDPSPVFKTGALNRSATLPYWELSHGHRVRQIGRNADLDSRRLPAERVRAMDGPNPSHRFRHLITSLASCPARRNRSRCIAGVPPPATAAASPRGSR